MRFREYLKILNCYIGTEKSQFDFMYGLFSLFVSEPCTYCDIKRDENDEYYPFSTLCGSDIAKKVYKGDRVLPKAVARFMISHFRKDAFVELLEETDEKVLENLCTQLATYGIECTVDNVSDVASDCFHAFLEAAIDESDTIPTGLSASSETRAESDNATNQDTLLLLEVSNKCPLCTAPLMIQNSKGKNIKRYKITQIFPENVGRDLYLAFNKHSRTHGNYNQPDNLIALCTDCSTDYLSEATEKEFLRLQKIKKALQQRNKLRQCMDDVGLESEICDVVNGMININIDGELTELRMNALKVRQKITPTNKLLIDAVSDDITHYYSYIESLFADIDCQKSGTFDRIASEVRLAYQKIKNEGLSQETVFEYMSNWLKEQLPLEQRNDMAISAVISFFVQNCEVFDEISE